MDIFIIKKCSKKKQLDKFNKSQQIENMGNVSILPVGFGNINENGVITDYELFGFDVIKN